MAEHRRRESNDSGYEDIPGRGSEEIRDEMEDEDEEFEDTAELDEEEEDDDDLGKDVRDAERGPAANRGFTAEIGSEGGSDGKTEVEREHGRRVNAGEATTTGGQPADEIRFDDRRNERQE